MRRASDDLRNARKTLDFRPDACLPPTKYFNRQSLCLSLILRYTTNPYSPRIRERTTIGLLLFFPLFSSFFFHRCVQIKFLPRVEKYPISNLFRLMNFTALKRLLVYSFACSAFCRSWNERERKRIEFINEINRYLFINDTYTKLGKSVESESKFFFFSFLFFPFEFEINNNAVSIDLSRGVDIAMRITNYFIIK